MSEDKIFFVKFRKFLRVSEHTFKAGGSERPSYLTRINNSYIDVTARRAAKNEYCTYIMYIFD